MDRLFNEHLKRYNPLKIGVEGSALQQVFNDFMVQRMIQEKLVKEVFPLKSNSSVKKETRIATLVPTVSMGKLWIYKKEEPSKRELLHELEMMTREACLSAHDDLADCLASFTESGFVVYPGEYRGSELGGSDDWDWSEFSDNYI
jgi:hypothetical protein